MNQLLREPRIVFFETMYGCTAHSEKRAGRDLTEREFKKWYNHVTKNMPDFISAMAEYSDEDGDEHEITQHWFIHEMNMWHNANSFPFN